MANFFDQFDAAPAQVAPNTGGNFFDQFDAPEGGASTSGRPRVVIDTSPKSIAERSDVTGSQPINARDLRVGLVNRGAQMTAQPRDNFAQILTDFENQGAAA